ncbi:LysR family transcriptional regulator [Lentilactobacillus sp. SPB1-3]|uniref:LysR family transcriptional regulator n=1 Tax=Lentilactobacillus terminaliae TaxID=3003483 RepID=A0ACD5DE11_9LACO|nr:LysR family transcriptional regulator [Lentilactobacillus sp. SPB1-3]MCZ0977536.1 LysR family transcriptional regulator [Lentilactobacillus sp. SPB1-3]
MNNKLLSFLQEIKAQGNMSKAAQALFVTQPYISRVIKNSEDHFGVKLINRSSHPLQLTYAGERLLDFLQEESQLQANLDREMTHLSQFKYGHLTIASNEAVSNDVYKPILLRFYEKYPEIHAQVISTSSSEAEQRLTAGSLDFFVGDPIKNHKIQYLPVANIPLTLIIPSNSAIYQPDKTFVDFSDLNLSKIADESFISIPRNNAYHRLIASFLSRQGASVEYSIEVPDISLAASLALNNLGLSIIPEPYVKSIKTASLDNLNIARIPNETLTAEFGISYVKSNLTAEPVDDLVNIISNVFKEITAK